MVALRRWLPIGLFVVIPGALLLTYLVNGIMLYGADVVTVFHYARLVVAEAFRAGRLPVWDPHVMAGFPLLAGVQAAVFYPPTWACVGMSAGAFWTLSAWAHLSLAGLFAHRWLERGLGLGTAASLTGALVFMFSGYLSGHVLAGHVNYVWAYPWIAAVLWRLERFLAAPTLKRGTLLSIVLALLFLAGVPQFVFFVGLLTLARLVHFVLATLPDRKPRAVRAAQAAAWMALGLLFCAPQLLPTLELVGEMQRGDGGSSSYFMDYSMRPEGLAELVIPLGVERRGPSGLWWETCGFVGGAVFLLAVAAFTGKHPQRHLWAGIAVVAVLLAMGDRIYFYEGFRSVVPGAAWFRGPGRYLLLFTVAMVALAGAGMDALWERGPAWSKVVAVVLGVAGVIQLLVFDRPCFQEQRAQALSLSSGLKVRLRNECGLEGRVAHSGSQAQAIGQCQAEGLDVINGYEPMMLRRYAELMNAVRGAALEMELVVLVSVGEHPVLDMLCARAWLLTTDTPFRAFPDRVVEPRKTALPRAWLVNHAVVLEDRAQRLKTLARGPWNPAKTVVLESYPSEAPPVPTEKPAGTAKVSARGAGYYEIEAENAADAYLVLSEACYPGWEAEVDGRPVEVLPANHLIQTVRLPAGKHRVRFQYRSRFLGLGFALSALAALVPVALLVHRHRRQLALQRLPGAP
ncbi:MAG: YfhO family protein [Planctomycetaceae bacterium]|nr:YfhO family protein [Planctomycetaceae bacterium]